MIMQQSLVYKRSQHKVCDRWEWIGAQFSARGAYKKLCEGLRGESIDHQSMYTYMETKGSDQCEVFWMVSSPNKTSDMSSL